MKRLAIYIACASLLGFNTLAYAQPFTPDQDSAFRDLLQISPERRAASATSLERRRLLNAQLRRSAVPFEIEAFKKYLDDNDVSRAVREKVAPELGTITFWNASALDIVAQDHTLPDPKLALPGQSQAGFEQYGPHRSSRALAIVHLAIFEAVNAIYDKYRSYHDMDGVILADLKVRYPNLDRGTIGPQAVSVDTAIAEAARDTLVALFPKKKAFIDATEQKSLRDIGSGTDPDHMETRFRIGYYLGRAAAKAVLADRSYDAAATETSMVSTFHDGSELPEPKASEARFAGGPDRWHPDPIHPLSETALGGDWAKVAPFVLRSADATRPAAEPVRTSPEFVASFKEVKRLGGDDTPNLQVPRATTRTSRTGPQTITGNFWAYDGTAFLCAPPRLYNEIATSIALKEKPIRRVIDMARYLALVNLALADAGIAAWDAKYAFRLGRPVTYIRAVGVDATAEGAASSGWTPIGAPVSNGSIDKRNFTPPFPSFPSGHAVFGGALFETLRLFYGTNGANEKFSFMSDEYNGENYGPGDKKPREPMKRPYQTFAEAERENARSRIYLGIHWQFDAEVGVAQGHEVAMRVFNNALRPKTMSN